MYRFHSYRGDELYDVTDKDFGDAIGGFGDAIGSTTDARARLFARMQLRDLRVVGVTRVEVFQMPILWTQRGMRYDDEHLIPVLYYGKPFIAR